jgi:hypothetical protein
MKRIITFLNRKRGKADHRLYGVSKHQKYRKEIKRPEWTETEICVCRLHDDVDVYSGLNHGT